MGFFRANRPEWPTLLSAALIVLAFPPWDLSFLIWFALVPWLFSLERSPSYRHAALQGLWLGFFMTLGGFYWVAFVLHEFGNLPWAVGILGLLLFAIVGQLQFPVFGMLYRWFARAVSAGPDPAGASVGTPAAATTLALALAYAGLDWCLPKIFADTLGHSLYAAPWLRQAADLGGATLLTLLIFAVNHALIGTAGRIGSRKEPSIWPALGASAPQVLFTVGLFAAFSAYGYFRLKDVGRRLTTPLFEAQASAIQGNIGDFDKIASERGIRGAGEKVISTYLSLSEQSFGMERKPDFLVWPETAYPSTFRTPNTADELARDQRVEAFVKSRGVPLLFGGYDRFQRKDYNALFLLSPRSEPGVAGSSDLQIYRKNILLVFGEFIPGADWIPWIKDTFPQVGNFGRGVGPEVLQIPVPRAPGGSVRTSPVICYEILFPRYVIEAARKGSQLILNITNDSWFGPYGEPQLHLALSVFRSIETRIPQLRATNTGYSALILPDGEITRRSALGEPEIIQAPIPILTPIPTLLKAWGDWFGMASASAGGGLLLLLRRRSRSRLGFSP